MTKYTNNQRKKVYKVKAKVKPTALPYIPNGKTTDARNARKNVIKKAMPEYYGVYYCPAIGENVVVNSKISLHKAVSAIKAPFCHYCINHLSIHKLKNKERNTAPYHDAP